MTATSSPPQEIIVPAAVVDTLIGLVLRLDVGKGVLLGFRATAGIPLDQPMRLIVQDAKLVPDTPAAILPAGERP